MCVCVCVYVCVTSRTWRTRTVQSQEDPSEGSQFRSKEVHPGTASLVWYVGTTGNRVREISEASREKWKTDGGVNSSRQTERAEGEARPHRPSQEATNALHRSARLPQALARFWRDTDRRKRDASPQRLTGGRGNHPQRPPATS